MEYSNSDKFGAVLACLAGVMAIVLFFLEKTPVTVVSLLLLMLLLLVYPVLHFVKRISWRLLTLGVFSIGTFLFGWHIWPHAQVSPQNNVKANPPTIEPPSAKEIAEEVAKKVPRQHDVEKQLKPGELKIRDKVTAKKGTPNKNLASAEDQQVPMVLKDSPGSAISINQQGGITAGTFIAGPPPPTFTLKRLGENLPVGTQFQTDYLLEVSTTVPLSLHVLAEAPSLGSHACLEVLRTYDGYESGQMREVTTGPGFCEGHVREVTSGNYHVVVHTTKPETINLKYEPD